MKLRNLVKFQFSRKTGMTLLVGRWGFYLFPTRFYWHPVGGFNKGSDSTGVWFDWLGLYGSADRYPL